jgi:Leucine-rich repeat (LRR) protein
MDLSHNRIESTSFLQSMGSLEHLNLSHNRIKEFQAVTMANLESLNLSENEIEKLPIIGICFPELVSLDISSNMICSEFELL